MTDKAYFSIIIPTLNEEKVLPYLLNDLKAQSFQDFEVIVVDAKSTDRTKKEAVKFENDFKEFLFIESDKKGASHQRNYGTLKASANWIIFMDADNRIPTYFLQGLKYRQELLNPDLLSTWIRPDSENRKDKAAATVMNMIIDMQKTTPTPYLLESMLLTRSNVFSKIGGFDETLTWGEGSDLLRRLVKKGYKFSFVRDPKYTFSFRRFRKQGTFKILRTVAQLELTRLANTEFSKKMSKRLYPMEGGKYFDMEDKTVGKIENILFNLIKRSDETVHKQDILTGIKNYLTTIFQNKRKK